jgi:hypothetical protein
MVKSALLFDFIMACAVDGIEDYLEGEGKKRMTWE